MIDEKYNSGKGMLAHYGKPVAVAVVSVALYIGGMCGIYSTDFSALIERGSSALEDVLDAQPNNWE